MENEHVLSGLIRKRAEIAGQLEAAQTQVRQLITDIDAVDATIRLFAPDIDLEEIRPKPLPPRHAARRGETSRFILSVLRETATPLTLSDLTLRVMQQRSLNAADQRLRRIVQKRVSTSLRHLRSRGAAQSTDHFGHGLRWLLPVAVETKPW